MVEEVLKSTIIQPIRVEERPAVPLSEMAEIWRRGIGLNPVTVGGAYLTKRCGITVYPKCLRMIDNTMIARVTDPAGKGVQLHKTIFHPHGTKAGRKMMRAPLPPGSAIRLHEPIRGVLGVAEGIETALSASQIFHCPVWALINANNLEKWVPPEGVEHIMIFGDNDRSYTGQASAYLLAKKLVAAGKFTVDVRIPAQSGWDWNDVYQGGLTP